jgi:hypothetical protein
MKTIEKLMNEIHRKKLKQYSFLILKETKKEILLNKSNKTSKTYKPFLCSYFSYIFCFFSLGVPFTIEYFVNKKMPFNLSIIVVE